MTSADQVPPSVAPHTFSASSATPQGPSAFPGNADYPPVMPGQNQPAFSPAPATPGWGPQPGWTGHQGHTLAGGPRHHRTGLLPLVLTGISGVLLGALMVGVLWAAGSALGGGDSAADADAEAACALLDRLPTTWTQETLSDVATTSRFGAAVSLATAAGEEDSHYENLAQASKTAYQYATVMAIESIGPRIQDARTRCDEL
ncbi:hypothetical protein [Actinoplanes sp. NPDC020271]|uniref:hypothetical protein n=1 Tax=Actinoplanes sp. NPDC020271 TaxID=3363896 RepID=UPI00379850DA